MTKSKRTSQLIKKRNLFFILSLILLVFCILYCVIGIIQHTANSTPKTEEVSILSEKITNYLFSLATTTLIGVMMSILIKDKARTLLYMLCVIMASILYQSVGMYVVLGCWFLDEYIFFALFKRFKNLVTINKEIDLREQTNEC